MAQDGEPTFMAATDEEMSVAFSGPAPGANRFWVTLGQPGVRIAFTEQVPNTNQQFFRTAVTLHPTDAISLYKTLAHLLQGIERLMVSVEPGTTVATPPQSGQGNG